MEIEASLPSAPVFFPPHALISPMGCCIIILLPFLIFLGVAWDFRLPVLPRVCGALAMKLFVTQAIEGPVHT